MVGCLVVENLIDLGDLCNYFVGCKVSIYGKILFVLFVWFF